MLKPLRRKILVARFPLDAPLGKPPGGGRVPLLSARKTTVVWCHKTTQIFPANMLALIVCPYKNVANTYACMLFTAYLHQKANWIIIPLRVNKFAHKCGMLFLFQPTLPRNLCTLPFSRTLNTMYPG